MKNQTPFCLRADAYTVGSNYFASQTAKEKSIYNFTNRYSPEKAFSGLCRDSRMVFFGVDWYVRNYLPRVTGEDVDDSVDFMANAHSFGGPIPFDRDMWDSVVNDYDGFLPIKIEAVEDGQTFFPNQPVVQVQSTASGFGELAAHIEAELVGIVSNSIVRLTVIRHWYQHILEIVTNEGAAHPEDVARFMIHDFGYRASSCPEEALLYGYIHLLVFNGTDTFNAAYLARKHGAKNPIGTSIQALAHRNVLGYENENDCFSSLLQSSKGCNFPIASYVGDCFNWKRALEALTELARENPKCTIVARPDSGDSTQTVIDVCDKNVPNLRFLQGDGIDYEKFTHIVGKMHDAGHKLYNTGIFGVGGWLRNTCTRDTFSSAYKLCSIGNSNTPVCKLSESITKMSIPGPTILRNGNESGVICELQSEYEDSIIPPQDVIPYTCYYNNGSLLSRIPDFMKKRDLVKSSFDSLERLAIAMKSDFIKDRFSEGINLIQQQTILKHRK